MNKTSSPATRTFASNSTHTYNESKQTMIKAFRLTGSLESYINLCNDLLFRHCMSCNKQIPQENIAFHRK